MLIKGTLQSSVIVRRSFLDKIGGFDHRTEIVGVEDFDTWLRIAALTDGFSFIQANLGYHLFNMHSTSRKDMSLPMRQVHAAHSHHLSPQEI